jgi:hypothetical protein
VAFVASIAVSVSAATIHSIGEESSYAVFGLAWAWTEEPVIAIRTNNASGNNSSVDQWLPVSPNSTQYAYFGGYSTKNITGIAQGMFLVFKSSYFDDTSLRPDFSWRRSFSNFFLGLTRLLTFSQLRHSQNHVPCSMQQISKVRSCPYCTRVENRAVAPANRHSC